MAGGGAKRSRPAGEAPWQTFQVRVCAVRGRREVRAEVYTSFVSGIVGNEGVRPKVVWSGVVAQRDPGTVFSPEDAARCAQYALGEAFPQLF